MKSDQEKMDLVGRYLTGEASATETTKLEQLMLADEQLRQDFLAYAQVDAALPGMISGTGSLLDFAEPPAQTGRSWKGWIAVAVAVCAVVAWLTSASFLSKEAAEVAHIAELKNCRWMHQSEASVEGTPLRVGQRIELSEGQAKVLFNTGAELQLEGPSILEVKGPNAAFLILGSAEVLADSKESQGFTLGTPSSRFVDLGTAFTASVAPDGLSRLEVSDGEVNLIVDHDHQHQLLGAGQAMLVEPGERKILTRIESGDESKDFRFPTIIPPSNQDYADISQGFASASVGRGILRSRPNWTVNPKSILDGSGQTNQDSPQESVFFENDVKNGSLLIDLGKAISIAKINSYSWHQHNRIPEHNDRAQQKFTLFGWPDKELPNLEVPARESGWVRIARVNSEQFFHVKQLDNRPSQQACSIFASKGEIGEYRYLLLEVNGPTFFGEIDVYQSE